MKVEVLKDIKNAEDEYKSTIATANETRRTIIASAEVEADNLVQEVTKQVEQYKKDYITDARRKATATYDKIVSDGKQQAADLESKGRQNLDEAIKLLETSHAILTKCLETLPDEALDQPIPTHHGKSAAHFFWIMIMHDLYHAGQIRTRRTMYRSMPARR